VITELDLGPDDVVDGRLFAHPDHIPADHSTLNMLVRDVARRIIGPDPISVWVPDSEHWYQRVIVPRPDRLLAATAACVVGFFGRRRDDVDTDVAATVFAISRHLEDQIPSVPGILAYSTRLLSDERNYANLVLMDDFATAARWRTVEPHPRASAELSRRFYDFVRIYRAELEIADITRDGMTRLLSVRYWDYRSDPVWTATRALGT